MWLSYPFQIPEFLAFEDHLDNSLQRDLIKLEHVRMRLTHESIASDLIDMELIELKFIFDRSASVVGLLLFSVTLAFRSSRQSGL